MKKAKMSKALTTKSLLVSTEKKIQFISSKIKKLKAYPILLNKLNLLKVVLEKISNFDEMENLPSYADILREIKLELKNIKLAITKYKNAFIKMFSRKKTNKELIRISDVIKNCTLIIESTIYRQKPVIQQNNDFDILKVQMSNMNSKVDSLMQEKIKSKINVETEVKLETQPIQIPIEPPIRISENPKEQEPSKEKSEKITDLMLQGHLFYFGSTNLKPDYESAMRYYKKAGELGVSDAYCAIARMFENGIGVETNRRMALHFYNKAYEQNNSFSQYIIGNYYEKGLLPDKYGKLCKSEAIKYFKKAAENGSDDAMVKLGRIYETGDEVHTNKEKAYAFYKEASKKENPLATNYQGVLEIQMKGNKSQGYECFNKSHNLGCPRGTNNLGICNEFGIGTDIDLDNSFRLYEEAGSKGLPSGLVNQAYLLIKKASKNNSEEQFKKAAKLLQEAISIDEKNLEACYYLGLLHLKGLGIDYDEHSAFYLLKKASDLGHEPSMIMIANILYTGTSFISSQKSEAFKIFEKISKKCNHEALNSMGLMIERGFDLKDPDPKKASIYYERAKEEGNIDAVFNLGLLYENGKGVEKSIAMGHSLISESARLGNNIAQQYLKEHGIDTTMDDSKKSNEIDANSIIQDKNQKSLRLNQENIKPNNLITELVDNKQKEIKGSIMEKKDALRISYDANVKLPNSPEEAINTVVFQSDHEDDDASNQEALPA